MREAYGWENDDLPWAGTVFGGGIAGQQRANCGALTAAGITIGLRHRTPAADEEAVARARQAAHDEANELVREFIADFGSTVCLDLVGVDFSVEGAFEQARKSGLLDRTCHVFIPFIVGKLYKLDEKRGQTEQP